MALIPATLFRPSGYSVEAIEFDLLLEEEHSMQSIVTNHSVEAGSDISDHIHNLLQEGSLSGLISNYSLNAGPFLVGVGERRDQKTYDAFIELRNRRELVTVVTYLQAYKDVAITSVGVARNSATGQAQDFQVSFQQVRIVRLKEVSITAGVVPGAMNTAQARQAAFNLNSGRTSPLFTNPLLVIP